MYLLALAAQFAPSQRKQGVNLITALGTLQRFAAERLAAVTAMMATVGVERQKSHVSAFHSATITPALRIGEKEDLYVKEGKVVVLGLQNGDGAADKADFEMDATHTAETPPVDVAHGALGPLVQATVHGIHGLLLVLGSSSSGKTELVHGQPEGGATEWTGLMESAINTLFAALPSDRLSDAENRYQVHGRMFFFLLGRGSVYVCASV